MRLIDADEIRWTNLEDGFGRIKECIAFATDIDAMPTMEVILCKDCKYNEYGYCHLYLSFHHLTADMDYCSDAERKEECEK